MTSADHPKRAERARITVLVPTYKRPRDLRRCLDAIVAQTRPADEVLVIYRSEDEGARAVIEEIRGQLPALRAVLTGPGGVVAALNAGLAEAIGDIVAITDDDAAPRPRWLERIEAHFRANPAVGGVGGRDWVHASDGVMTGSEHLVGKVTWYGRLIGAHHLGVGEPREVDVLKGCNMSFRRAALDGVRLDGRLRGAGAQIHNELALSIRVRENGWKLLYDPQVEVDHYPSVRHDKDQRRTYSSEAQYDINYNQALVLVGDAPIPLRAVRFIYKAMIGSTEAPGIVKLAQLLAHREPHALTRFRSAQRALLAAAFGPRREE